MPKITDLEGGAMMSFSLLPEQKLELKNEAHDLHISVGKLIRNKLFLNKDELNKQNYNAYKKKFSEEIMTIIKEKLSPETFDEIQKMREKK